MKRKKFIKKHILPYEDDKTKVDYYEGRIDTFIPKGSIPNNR